MGGIEFSRLMRTLRKDAGMTLKQVARRVGTTKGYVSGWETGKTNPPSSKIIRRLARLFRANEVRLQMLAWCEKAPKVCRRELLRRIGW